MLKETNNNVNLETNSTLKKLVEEAYAQNVPKATVEKILKRSIKHQEIATEFLLEIRGPGLLTGLFSTGYTPVKNIKV